jgi:hypothetical protein
MTAKVDVLSATRKFRPAKRGFRSPEASGVPVTRPVCNARAGSERGGIGNEQSQITSAGIFFL